jgi:hypothetical protein
LKKFYPSFQETKECWRLSVTIGDILSPKEILHCYQHVIKSAASAKPEESIAVLSAGERTHWASLRSQLANAGNQSLLKKLDSAIFLLCLDGTDTTDVKQYCKNMLHGDGSNRWVFLEFFHFAH